MLDVFFQPEYGKLYENTENGECKVFQYTTNTVTIHNIFIKRPVPWLVDNVQYYDVTTPYGYGGPVIVDGVSTPGSLEAYYSAWAEYCKTEKIVAEFIRFHLFDNIQLREAFPGEVIPITENVVRWLDKNLDDMWMDFEHKVRKNVKKAQNNGLTVTVDSNGEQLETFLDIYYKTMERNEAKSFYYFDRAYFQAIIDTLHGHFMFFHVWKDDVIVSTELVLCSEKYVYSFLGGTIDKYYPMRPNDLLKYEIIKWSKETGHQAFILGGGYGTDDGIYQYKKTFAPGEDVPFYVGRKVWDEVNYRSLVERRQENETNLINASFFPLYRG